MRNKTVIQIVLIVLSVVIIITYIKPTIGEMENIRTEADEYQKALKNAASYSAAVQALYERSNSFTVSERRALERFLPEKVDPVAVMRDIATIVENHAMPLNMLTSDSEESTTNNEDEILVQGQDTQDNMPVNIHKFTFSILGTYDQFKLLLHDLERNAYPLEVVSLSIVPANDDLYNFELALETYSLVSDE